MGIALFLETIRSPSFAETRLLLPLAIFGILHGMHEWFEFFLRQATWLDLRVSAQIYWLRMALLAISFIALGLYGLRACQQHRPECLSRLALPLALLGLYILAISVIWAFKSADLNRNMLINNLIRYLLAVPAAILASLGLSTQKSEAREENRFLLSKKFHWASLGFGIYGISQLFVPPLALFPANIINNQLFFSITGLPIEAVRAVVAFAITTGIVQAVHTVEKERQKELFDTQKERVDALEYAQKEMAAREALQQKLFRYTVQAQEEERARISRELHDETAQILSAFSLELAALGNRLDEPPAQLTPTLNRLQTLSQDMSQGIYRLVHDLRPAQLDDLGLVPAIQNLIGNECCKMELDVVLEVDGKSQRVDPLVETVLYRVAQAALTNVARHARTQQADVQIRFDKDRVTLNVEDQGVGFDSAEALIAPRGWGLEGMKERVSGVGGEFYIKSNPGKGTTVTAVLPCIAPAEEQNT